MRIRRTTIGVGATCLALLLSGCSDDADDTASSSTTSSAATTAASAAATTAASSAAPAAETSAAAPASETAAASAAPAAAEPVTLSMWKWTIPTEPQLQKAIDAYKLVAPHVTVKVNPLSQDDFKAKVPLALNSGETIDILGVQPNLFAEQIKDKLLPLDDWSKFMPEGTIDKIDPMTLDQAKKLFSDGTNRVLPMGSSGSAVAFYNASMLKEVGVEPPKTWEEMASLAKVLKEKKPGVAVAVMPSGGDSWFQDEMLLTLVGQEDPKFFDEVRYNKGSWNKPAYVEALTQWQNLYKTGAMDKAVVDLGYGDAMAAFHTGKAAIVFNGTWESTMLSAAYRKANKINIEDVGAMPVPGLKGADNRGLRSFLDMALAIPKDSKHAEEAAKFIAFLTAGDGLNEWAQDLGLIPVVKGWKAPEGVLASPAAQEGFQAIQTLIANPRSDRNNLSAFSGEAGKRIMGVINGDDPAKAVKGMQEDLDSGKFN